MRLLLLVLLAVLLGTVALAYSVRPQPETVRAEDSMVRTLPTSPPLVPELGDVAALGRAQTTTTRPVADVWTRIAQCESGGRWDDTRGGYEGGVHFLHATWIKAGGRRFAEHAYQATREQQIEVATSWLARTSWAQWPVCSRKVGAR